MGILVAYVADRDTKTPLFSVVANDSGAQYYYPKGVDNKFPKDWVAKAPERLNVQPPTEASEWLALALAGVNDISVTRAEEVASPAMAKARANELLKQGEKNIKSGIDRRATLASIAEAFDTIAETYPDLFDGIDDEDDEAGVDPAAMLTLAQLQHPGSRPDDDHEFLPDSIEDMDTCFICSMPLDWEAHTNSGTMPNTNYGASGG